MERKEPHFGTPDLSDIEFQPRDSRRHAPPTTNANTGLSVWKLALGIFLGLSAFGIGTLVFLGMAAQAAMEEQERREKLAAEEFKKALNNPDPFGWHAAGAKQRAEDAAQAARIRAAKQLKPGERCIHGRRFKRVENGWVQLPSQPC
jgi:hypothetical protein